MSISFKIKIQGYLQHINRLFFLIMVATIPLPNKISSLAIVCFCVSSLFIKSFPTFRTSTKSSKFWCWSVAYFFWMFLSLFWEPSKVNILKSLESYTSFLLLIPVIALNPGLTRNMVKRSNHIFVIAVLLITLTCYFRSAVEYLQAGDYRVFYYHYLSGQVKLNAIYLSLYCSYSFFVILYYYNSISAKYDASGRILFIILSIFLSITVVLLSSKMIIVFHFLALLVLAIRWFARKKRLILGICIILLFSGLSVVLVWNLPYLKWRVQETLFKKYENNRDDQNGFAVRQKIWQYSVELVREKPIFGHGLRSGYQQLLNKYEEHNFKVGIEAGYNAHNNYLQIWLNCGVIGVILLLGLQFSALKKALAERNFLLTIFMFLVISLCLTECVLEVQKGIVFFSIFCPLLIYHFKHEEI